MARMRSTYLTIVYIVLTNKPPTEKPRAVTPALVLVLVPPKPKPKPKMLLFMDSDSDLDLNSDSNSSANAAVSLKKLDKGKGKATDPPEDLNEGPAPRVHTTFLLNNVLTIQAELYSHETEGGEPLLGSHVQCLVINMQVVCQVVMLI